MGAIAAARLPAASSGWLLGPAPDLLLGCGLLSLLAFGAFMLGGETLRIAQPALVFPLGVLLLGMAHYGGTLLRVYERARDRRAYALFSVGATVAVAALGPAAPLAATQALWFALPAAALMLGTSFGFEAFDPRQRAHYITWIALFHSVQHLWVTTYCARQSEAWSGFAPYAAKVLAAGAAIWTLPSLAFGPAALGLSSMDAGLALLIASAVNVHHFILDGAIWKLRGRIGEILIRAARDDADDARPSLVLRPLVWSACAALFVAALWLVFEEERSRRATSRPRRRVRRCWRNSAATARCRASRSRRRSSPQGALRARCRISSARWLSHPRMRSCARATTSLRDSSAPARSESRER